MKDIYPKELVDTVKKLHYIPRKLNKNEHLKLYHRYWIPDLGGIVKVKDIWKDNNIEYYIIKYRNGLHVCFSYPLDDYSDSYELLHDYDDIYKDNIVNSDKSYTGAEIKYWFTINCSKTHEKFSKYLNPIGKLFLFDNKKYNVIINSKNKYEIEISK